MRRAAFAVLSVCVSASLNGYPSAAVAGGYHGYDRVWYSESCCYRKIVRHERRVGYVPVGIGAYIEPHRVVQVLAPPDPLLYDSALVGFVSDHMVCTRRLFTADNGLGGWRWVSKIICY